MAGPEHTWSKYVLALLQHPADAVGCDAWAARLGPDCRADVPSRSHGLGSDLCPQIRCVLFLTPQLLHLPGRQMEGAAQRSQRYDQQGMRAESGARGHPQVADRPAAGA